MSNKKLKQQQKHNKISIPQTEDMSERQEITISFKYLINNKKYTFDYFNASEKDNQLSTMIGLYNRLTELTKRTWHECQLLRKGVPNGFEKIYRNSLNVNIDNKDVLKHEKLYVVRFDTFMGTNKGRIIGFKEKNNPTFYIICFEFDYSAYNHGS